MSNISELVGKTIVSVLQDDYTLEFVTLEGDFVQMFHNQDCCEAVFIEDVNGDWEDIKNTPLIVSEERESEDCPNDSSIIECDTWTFYTFRTIKGSVDVRWHGTSNGYYSTSVSTIISKYEEK